MRILFFFFFFFKERIYSGRAYLYQIKLPSLQPCSPQFGSFALSRSRWDVEFPLNPTTHKSCESVKSEEACPKEYLVKFKAWSIDVAKAACKTSGQATPELVGAGLLLTNKFHPRVTPTLDCIPPSAVIVTTGSLFSRPAQSQRRQTSCTMPFALRFRAGSRDERKVWARSDPGLHSWRYSGRLNGSMPPSCTSAQTPSPFLCGFFLPVRLSRVVGFQSRGWEIPNSSYLAVEVTAED